MNGFVIHSLSHNYFMLVAVQITMLISMSQKPSTELVTLTIQNYSVGNTILEICRSIHSHKSAEREL